MKETDYWVEAKKKHELQNNFFVNPLFLAMVCIIYGLVYFNGSHYFWEFEFSNFFFLFILTAFWISCLVSIGVVDYSLRLIPYSLTLPLALVGMVRENGAGQDYVDTIFLVLILVFILVSRKLSTSINRKFGLGDIAFLLALSFWLNTISLAITVFFSTTTMVIIFVIFKKQLCWTQKTKLPFAPVLSFFSIILEPCWVFMPI